MIKVYGASDDLVEIEGSKYPNDEIGCYGADVQIEFVDSTVIQVHYGKDNDTKGIWSITILHKGSAYQDLLVCEDENARIYSDIFLIAAEVKQHELLEY